jgi:hypothetical protein
MKKFTQEQWHQALCDAHVMIFEGGGIPTIWWTGSRLALGTEKSNCGKLVWSCSPKNARPTYEQALDIVNSI